MKDLYKTLVLGCLLSTSCEKPYHYPLDFDVQTASKTYTVNESVQFTFSGNPDIITFYSGEKGKKYSNKERIEAEGKVYMEFRSVTESGEQDHTLKLLVSDNFSTIYNAESIQKAEWHNITDRAIWAEENKPTPSGKVDLTDFASNGKPLTIAFQYLGYPDGKPQRSWTISNWMINNVLNDSSSFSVGNLLDSYFVGVDILNPQYKWNVSSTQLKISGDASGSSENNDWVISKPLNLNKVVPDLGVPLKDITSNRLQTYEYTFNEPGIYEVTFEASNRTIERSESMIRQLEIEIKP